MQCCAFGPRTGDFLLIIDAFRFSDCLIASLQSAHFCAADFLQCVCVCDVRIENSASAVRLAGDAFA